MPVRVLEDLEPAPQQAFEKLSITNPRLYFEAGTEPLGEGAGSGGAGGGEQQHAASALARLSANALPVPPIPARTALMVRTCRT